MQRITGSPPNTPADFLSTGSRALKPGGSSLLNLRAFDRAPIKIIGRKDLKTLAAAFLANVESNTTVHLLQQHEASGSSRANTPSQDTDRQMAEYSQQRTYDERLIDTCAMIKDLPDLCNPEMVMAYFVDHQPVGVLAMENTPRNIPAHIELCVTHPLSRGVGAALIERAVAQAVAWGKHGILLDLISLTPESSKAYEAFGFVNRPHGMPSEMQLDPQKSEKWQHRGGQWQLQNSDTNKKYIG